MIVWKCPLLPVLDKALKRLDDEPFVFTIQQAASSIQVIQEYQCDCGRPILTEARFDPDFLYGLPDTEAFVDSIVLRLDDALRRTIHEHILADHRMPVEPPDVTPYGIFHADSGLRRNDGEKT